VRPDGIAGDPQGTDAGRCKILAPVTQEQDLVRSGGRPVPQVEAQKRQSFAEDLAERAGAFAGRGPDADVRDAVAGAEHLASLVATSYPTHPSMRGNEPERNCSETFATARMRFPPASTRTKTH
jgi:hypothetical protein